MKGAEWIKWMEGKLKDRGRKVNIIMVNFKEGNKFSLVVARRERGDLGLRMQERNEGRFELI